MYYKHFDFGNLPQQFRARQSSIWKNRIDNIVVIIQFIVVSPSIWLLHKPDDYLRTIPLGDMIKVSDGCVEFKCVYRITHLIDSPPQGIVFDPRLFFTPPVRLTMSH